MFHEFVRSYHNGKAVYLKFPLTGDTRIDSSAVSYATGNELRLMEDAGVYGQYKVYFKDGIPFQYQTLKQHRAKIDREFQRREETPNPYYNPEVKH